MSLGKHVWSRRFGLMAIAPVLHWPPAIRRTRAGNRLPRRATWVSRLPDRREAVAIRRYRNSPRISGPTARRDHPSLRLSWPDQGTAFRGRQRSAEPAIL